MSYNWNVFSIVGLAFIMYGILILLFPPKYGDDIFGIYTKITMRTKDIWLHGQKLFAYALITMGLVYFTFSILENSYQIKYTIGVISIMVFWKWTKYLINKFLANKYLD
jgi:uncharacterized membrane protein